MKFIVLDEDKKMLDKEKSIISKVLFPYDIDFKINLYQKVDKKLEQEISDNSLLKVYILDFNLNSDISGMDVALKIREKDWDSIIIFITNHGDMFETVHRNVINIYDFIEKYQSFSNRLTKDLKNIIKHRFDNSLFKYNCCSNYLQIYNKSINYIKRDTKLRKLKIYTETKEFIVNITIKELLTKLDKRFIQVSKSTIVNLDNIIEIDWNKGYFILQNNSIKYYVSKKYQIKD